VSGKAAALSALAIVCVWDILRPRHRSCTGRKTGRHLRLRSFNTCIDGAWVAFSSYREYRQFNRRTRERERIAFEEGVGIAIDNAAMKAADMGHPEIRDAINGLMPERRAPAAAAPQDPGN